MLKSTNGLLCPGDLVAYQQSDPRGKSKSSTIVSLLDPSTQDKKEIILENGDILRPFIYEVKCEKMYGGGACGHVTDLLSVWMKLEHCAFFVGCTSNFSNLMMRAQIPMTKMIAPMMSTIIGKVSSNIQNIWIPNILISVSIN